MYPGVVVDLTGTKYGSSMYIPIFGSDLPNMSSRYYARVEKVYPPKYSADVGARDAYKDSLSSSLEDEQPHVIGGDLKIPNKDANIQDDPTLYFYWVHIIELEKDKGHEKKQGGSKNAEKDSAIGSLMEVQCGMMRCD